MKIQNKLAKFEKLENLGINNFVTFSNEIYSNIRPSHKSSPNYFEFKQLFSSCKKPILMAVEHSDDIRFIDNKNYTFLEFMNKESDYIFLSTDGIITKESIPLVLMPADCAGVVITGIDELDNRRFIIFLHIGFIGAFLNLIEKSISTAKSRYKFKNKDLESFIFPHISGENYLKTETDDRIIEILKNMDHKKYFNKKNDLFEVHFDKKITDDLIKFGIDCEHSNLNSFEENQKDNLFSLTYLKQNKLDETKRFGIGIQLQK